MNKASLRSIKAEPGAEDRLDTTSMQPYVTLALAAVGGKVTRSAVEKVAALPLEKRYAWRVASALRRAFADFESLTVAADRRALGREDLDTLAGLLASLIPPVLHLPGGASGEGQMEKLISAPVGQVKSIRRKRRQRRGGEPAPGAGPQHPRCHPDEGSLFGSGRYFGIMDRTRREHADRYY